MSPRSGQPGSGTSRPLLFERLAEAGPGAPGSSPRRDDDRAAVEASVAREVAALLGTRIEPAIDAIDPRDRTVLDYGLPDFTGLSPQSATDRERLARSIERAITAFEPRLASPRVAVFADEGGAHTVSVAITGILTVNDVAAAYNFPVHLGEPAPGDGN